MYVLLCTFVMDLAFFCFQLFSMDVMCFSSGCVVRCGEILFVMNPSCGSCVFDPERVWDIVADVDAEKMKCEIMRQYW